MNKQLLEIYNKSSDTWGLPQKYKNIEFYPLKISEDKYIRLFNKLFSYPQIAVSINDPTVHKMSYLKFLIYILPYIMGEQDECGTFEQELKEFLAHITKTDIEDIEFSSRNEGAPIENLLISLFIGEEIFTEAEFANIREIVLQQNGSSVDYVESYSSNLEKDLIFATRNMEQYSFNDQIFTFASLLKKGIGELKNCTLFQMRNLLDSMGAIETYRMQTIPLTHVGKKYDFKHYMKTLKVRGRYDDILQDVNSFKENTSYFDSEQQIAGK